MDELLFAPPDTTLDHCFRVATQYNSMDVEPRLFVDHIQHSAALWLCEDAYREETKDEHRVFLFVGKNAIKGLARWLWQHDPAGARYGDNH